MERGSDKHSARQDDALQAELSGRLGPHGGHRDEWLEPEPLADESEETDEPGETDADGDGESGPEAGGRAGPNDSESFTDQSAEAT
jgi:hypothetical protein